MNLVECFDMNRCDKGTMKHRYDRVYEPMLAPFCDKSVRLLEIGVFKGASLKSWLQFLPNATIVVLDTFQRISPEKVPPLKNQRVQWYQCSSLDTPSIKFENDQQQGFDFIIDDGLHTHLAQRLTFKNYFPFLKPSGSYFIEDVWPFDCMSEEEKKHSWLIDNPSDYSTKDYNDLLNEILPYDVTYHDLRKNFQPDSFIIEVKHP